MASVLADVLSAHRGFMAAADVLNGFARGAAAAPTTAGAGAGATVAGAADGAAIAGVLGP